VSSFGGPGISEGVLLNLVKPTLDARGEVTVIGVQRSRTPDDSQILAHREAICCGWRSQVSIDLILYFRNGIVGDECEVLSMQG